MQGTHRSLAILGGPPRFRAPLYVGGPNLLNSRRAQFLIGAAFARNRLTNDGPLVQALEARFAAFHGVAEAIAVVNATIGLQVLARALSLSGEVVIPSFTFVGTAHAMRWLGLEPVFCDVRPDTHTVDPASVERAITSRTSAILGVHLWGQPCDVIALEGLASAARLPLLFDAAHATGSYAGRVPVGSFGAAEVFSLHATKSINGVEGGVITTNDRELAAALRRDRNFGFVAEDAVVGLGINAKMHELSAAVALANLEEYERLRDHNAALQRVYQDGLGDVAGIRFLKVNEGNAWSGHYAVLEVDGPALDRDELCQVLRAEGVVARRYFTPGCHRTPPYDAGPPRAPLPVTETLARTALQLPTGVQLTPRHAREIVEVIREANLNAGRIRAALGSRPQR